MGKNTLVIGFAIFTMFYGAGNMVLPLVITQKWGNYCLSSFIGFCITGVLVTLLGLIASVLSGNIKSFFDPLGTKLSIIIQIILIFIEGPLGVVPRTMIVSYGSFKSILPHLDKFIFYGLSCFIIYFFAINRNRIINFLGKILTPIMLLFLIILISTAYKQKDYICNLEFAFSFASFYDGLVAGYLTYDLPGAIYFTSIALGYLKSIGQTKPQRLKEGLKASFVSAILLTIVYFGFIYLGIQYNDLIKDSQAEMILPTIVRGSLGITSHIMFAVFIFLACLTTAIAAITIWTDFVIFIISEKLNYKKLSYKFVLKISLVLAFFVSNLDFVGLVKILSPILQIIYPLLILLACYNIYINRHKFNQG